MFPYTLDLDIVTECNLRCRHCNRLPTHYEPVLATERLLSLIDELYDFGVAELLLTGGEPTCRDDWLNLIVAACNHTGMKVILTTNGTRWRDKDIEILSSLREPPHIALSLDGPNPEIYGILRRTVDGRSAGNLFDRVIETGKHLIDAGLHLCINIVVTDETQDHICDTIRLAGSMGAESILLIKLMNIGGEVAGNVGLSYDSWVKVLSEITASKLSGECFFDLVAVSVACPWEIVLPLRQCGLDLEDISRLWHYRPAHRHGRIAAKRGMSCTAGSEYGSIDVFGNVYPCSVVPLGCESLIAGNVQDRSFASVWTDSPLLHAFRKLTLESIDTEGCGSCRELSWCGGGCRVRAFFYGGSLTASDPACPLHLCA